MLPFKTTKKKRVDTTTPLRALFQSTFPLAAVLLSRYPGTLTSVFIHRTYLCAMCPNCRVIVFLFAAIGENSVPYMGTTIQTSDPLTTIVALEGDTQGMRAAVAKIRGKSKTRRSTMNQSGSYHIKPKHNNQCFSISLYVLLTKYVPLDLRTLQCTDIFCRRQDRLPRIDAQNIVTLTYT